MATFMLIYDVESTSNRVKNHSTEIIEIAVLMTQLNGDNSKFELVETFHSYIEHKNPSEPGAIMVHGVLNSKLDEKTKLSLHMFWRKMSEKMQTRVSKRDVVILASHNGSKFDDLVMFSHFFREGQDFFCAMKNAGVTCFLDTLPMLKTIFGGMCDEMCPKDPITLKTSFALGNVLNHFYPNRKFEDAHTADGDCVALLDVINALMSKGLLNRYVLSKCVVDSCTKREQIQSFFGIHHFEKSKVIDLKVPQKTQHVKISKFCVECMQSKCFC